MKLLMLATFVGFTLLVALISYLKTKGDDTSTKDGYFLAGRGLPGIVICGSLMMTNISAEQLVGQNGQSYVSTMGVMGWELFASASLIIFALFMLPKFLSRNITTIPEFLEDRFGSSIRRLVAIIFMAAYIITMLPLILYAGSVVLEQLFDVSGMLGISRFAAIAICCVSIGIIGSIYAIFGGLRAVAVSDTINGIGLMVGCAVIVPLLAFAALGGGSLAEGIRLFAHAGEKLNAMAPANALAPRIPWPLLLTGMFINGLSYWATNQSIIQRTFAAKNLAEAQKGSLWTGLLKCVSPLFTVVPGIIAFLMFGSNLESQDLAYPQLILTVMPKWMLGFFAAVMFGAILSSFNSVLNSSMTLFTLDILPVISKKKRTDAQLITIAKRFGIVLWLASIVIAPFLLYLPAGISTFLNQMWGYYGVPVLAIVVMGILAPRMPSFAPKLAIVVHIVCYGLMMNLLPFHFLYFEVGAFVIDIILMAVLTKAAPRKEAYVLPDLEVVDMTPWKYRMPVIAVTFVLLIAIYVVFSPLGLGG